MNKEIWIQIYNNKRINKKGEIMSYARCEKGKIMKPSSAGRKGIYSVIKFSKKHSNSFVHRLMGEAFLGLDISDSKTLVCHKKEKLINGRLNNSLDNLFLGTHKDNIRDCINKGRKPDRKMSKIYEYDLNNNFVKIWNGINNAARIKKIDPSSIVKCCKGKLKSAGKAKWKYLQKKDSN